MSRSLSELLVIGVAGATITIGLSCRAKKPVDANITNTQKYSYNLPNEASILPSETKQTLTEILSEFNPTGKYDPNAHKMYKEAEALWPRIYNKDRVSRNKAINLITGAINLNYLEKEPFDLLARIIALDEPIRKIQQEDLSKHSAYQWLVRAVIYKRASELNDNLMGEYLNSMNIFQHYWDDYSQRIRDANSVKPSK